MRVLFHILFAVLLLTQSVSAQAQGLSLADPAFVGSLVAPASGGGYTANAVEFDGTSDFMQTSAGLTGAVDSKVLTVSLWMKLNGGNGVTQRIINNFTTVGGTTYRFVLNRTQGNKLNILANNSSGTLIYNASTIATYTASTNWNHVAISVDLASAGTGQIYVDGASDYAETTAINDTIDWTVANTVIGANGDGGQKLNACLAEVYYNIAARIDFSVAANLQKFRSADGNPVSLGSDGSTPTGTAPIVYLPGNYTTFTENSGTGGNFTVTGSLTACSDAP